MCSKENMLSTVCVFLFVCRRKFRSASKTQWFRKLEDEVMADRGCSRDDCYSKIRDIAKKYINVSIILFTSNVVVVVSVPLVCLSV